MENITLGDSDIEELASQYLKHKKLYYSGKSIISNAEFDALEDRLKSFSPDHPYLSIVGALGQENTSKIPHAIPMLSLLKTYSVPDLFAFTQKYNCVCLDKLDGMALCLEYNSAGDFIQASTRGDGRFGEAATEQVLQIKHIPKKIQQLSGRGNYRYEIRGEVFFPLSLFAKFEDKFDSFRNAVPGTFNRKDVLEASEVLNCFEFSAFDILCFDGQGASLPARQVADIFAIEPRYVKKLEFLQKLGFSEKIFYVSLDDVGVTGEKHVGDLVANWFARQRDYQIDGIVFRIDNEVIWESLGNTAHHPRGSVAFKQPGETAITEILAIEESIGRSGKVTFRAKLNPVFLSGATISYASLHNAEYIREGHYAPGAQVEVIRSGEVIPSILRLVEPASSPYQLPQLCPCGYPLSQEGPDLLCKQKIPCPSKDQESLVYFIHALDIIGVSDKLVFKMREAGLITEPADFYKIRPEHLMNIEGFGKKSAENTVRAIQERAQIPLAKFLTSLGLKRGGAVKCQEVARKFKTIERVLSLKEEDLLSEKGWAQKSVEDFINSLKEKENVIKNLLEFVQIIQDSSALDTEENKNHLLYAKNICITGALSKPREEYKALLEKIGAKFVSSVTSKTDFLVCNEASTSSKYKDAQKHGVPILTEEEFLQKLL